MTYPLDLRNITVTYPDGPTVTTALDAADLQVPAGQATALVGESGSGKSTLLSVGAGLVVPDSGGVCVAGTDLTDAPDKLRSQTRRNHIGMIFQQANLIASLTVREQLEIVDHISGRKRRPRHADELLEQVGLGGLGGRRMQQLSGGQRQRVNIARALMADPEVLLADEPTSALDSKLSQQIMDLLIRLTRERDLATVVVTHDRGLAAECDAVVEVNDGKVKETIVT